jgi:Purine catabolism regulatory protein-like family/PucR C-terminal helix-turn-helix domain
VLLRALVDSPELRLRVLTGDDALDRPVGGVFTTDLLDPSRYLSGGEIVLTGLMWHRVPADSAAFVSALEGAGVAALAAGDAALGAVPPDLVEACRAHRLPLLEVPVDVSFAVITERVMRSLLPAGPGPAVARLRRLAAEQAGAPPAHPEPADAMAALLAVADAEYGVTGWVLSGTGRLVAGALPVPGAALRSALARAGLEAPDFPAAVTVDGAPFLLYPVAGPPGPPGPPEYRLACWFVAVAGDHAAWDEERHAVAAELATLVAGHRARHEEGRRAARRSADVLLHRLLGWRPGRAGGAEREIAAALGRCGLPLGGPLVAVVVAAPHAGDQPVAPSGGELPGAVPAWDVPAGVPGTAEPGAAQEAARVLLEEMLPGALVGVGGATAVALASGAGDVLSQIWETVGALGRVPGLDLPFGVSVQAAAGEPAGAGGDDGREPAGAAGDDGGEPGGAAGGDGAGPAGAGTGSAVGGVARVVAEARQAVRLAELLGGGVRMVDSGQFGSWELLLAMVPGEARRAFRAALLDPLVAYDRDHGTELVATLEAFLACSGSWTKAAEAMFIHVNSLRYRIRRIEELTGRDPRSLAGQAALLLALRMPD